MAAAHSDSGCHRRKKMIARPLRRARAVNSSSSAFSSFPDTLTEPSGDAGTAAGRTIIDIAIQGGGQVPTFLELFPFALANSNDAFSLRVLAWQRLLPPLADGRFQWAACELVELACTVGASTGVAGGVVLDTELYVDTITIVAEETVTADVTRFGSVEVFSPANDTKAHVRLDLEGVEKIELVFDQTTNTPLMNALYRYYDRYAFE